MEAEELKSRVRSEYDAGAGAYDRRWRRYISASVRETVRRIPAGALASALDIGCGTGSLMSQIAGRHPGCEIVGMDLSPSMAAAASRRVHGRAAVIAADAERLPFRDRSFDLLVSSSSFHFWPNPAAALLECRRVLRRNGHLVITDWCSDFLLCRVCERLLRLRYGSAHRVYGAEECEALLREASFEPLHIDRYRISWLWGLMTAIARPAA